jgi:hypothetical protein
MLSRKTSEQDFGLPSFDIEKNLMFLDDSDEDISASTKSGDRSFDRSPVRSSESSIVKMVSKMTFSSQNSEDEENSNSLRPVINLNAPAWVPSAYKVPSTCYNTESYSFTPTCVA